MPVFCLYMEQETTWTDCSDGVPYLWTSHISAKDAKNILQQQGVPCRTVKIAVYAYGVERKSDGRMLSEDGRRALNLPY